MKEYYIYDSEFRELKRTGAIATILFAIGSALIGFSINVQLGITFAENVPIDTKQEWTVYRNIAVIIAVVCYVFAVITAFSGYNQVEQIKAQTSHGEEKYKPKPWYRRALWALVFLVVLAIGIFLGRLF